MNKEKTNGFASPILILLLVVASFLMGMIWTQSRQNGNDDNQPIGQQEEAVLEQEQEEQVLGESVAILGNFKALEETEVCLEDDKPLVYYFGGSFCPYCKWEHPIISSVAEKFKGHISFHDNMDKTDADLDIVEKYAALNRGHVPFLLIGCQYWQLGSGEAFGEEQETKHITALICKITNNEPEEVCAPLQETIDSI